MVTTTITSNRNPDGSVTFTVPKETMLRLFKDTVTLERGVSNEFMGAMQLAPEDRTGKTGIVRFVLLCMNDDIHSQWHRENPNKEDFC